MYSLAVKDHFMIAHSFRGAIFGPRPEAARRDLRRDGGIPPCRTRPRRSCRRHRTGHTSAARSAGRLRLSQPSTTSQSSRGKTRQRSSWPRRSTRAWPPRPATVGSAAIPTNSPACASSSANRRAPGPPSRVRRHRRAATTAGAGSLSGPRVAGPADRWLSLRRPHRRRPAQGGHACCRARAARRLSAA